MMGESASESHRIAIAIQCSARKSKWAPKWADLSLISEFGNLGVPAVTTSLRVKLPCAVLKVSLAVKRSVCKGSTSSTVRKTVKFFGLLKTRKTCLRLCGCFTNLKEKCAFLRKGCDWGGGKLRKGVQRRKKLVELEDVDQQEETFDKSLSELATWVFRRWNYQQSQSKGFLGNWSVLSQFASEKKRTIDNGFKVGVVLLTLMLARQLGTVNAVWSPACTATAWVVVVVVVGLVLNFFGVKNKLSSEFGKLCGEAVSVGGETISPQVMWTVVEPFIRRSISIRMLIGTASLFMIILFQLLPLNWGP